MREIKFKYLFEDIKEDGRNIIKQIYTLKQIEQNEIIYDKDILIAKTQYTGLKDKNNVEIYEGDIVTHEDFKELSEVTFERGCFRIHNFTIANFEAIHHMGKIEVIGNIHENQELLE